MEAGVWKFRNDKGRLLAWFDKDNNLVYRYKGFGGDIVTAPDRATTVLGKFIEHLRNKATGTRYFLGSDMPPLVEGFPAGTIHRGVDGIPPKGGINFLDLPGDKYQKLIIENTAAQKRLPANKGLPDTEIKRLGLKAANEQFWKEYNLPFLEDAFKRGDNVRLTSNPAEYISDINKGGFYRRELMAIEGVPGVPGLAERYGYVYDSAAGAYVKKK